MLLFKIPTTLVFGFSRDDLTELQGNLQNRRSSRSQNNDPVLGQGPVRLGLTSSLCGKVPASRDDMVIYCHWCKLESC